MRVRPDRDRVREFFEITAGGLALALGNYFFKFPNHFVFGGVTGLSVILARVVPFSVSSINLVVNALFLLLGFVFLGKGFGIKTVFATVLMTLSLSLLEIIYPMEKPFTGQPMLEFSIAILLTAFGSAVLFHCEASSGGTDILAMILRKYTGHDIAWMLLLSDVAIVMASFAFFDIQTSLYSSLGLLIKTLMIDTSAAWLNRSRMVDIICDDPDPVCGYIIRDLHKDATFFEATGAYSRSRKYVILCALRPRQERKLRRYIRDNVPSAFVLVSDSSSIFGKGFSHIS